MPPRKKARGSLAQQSAAASARDDNAMDIDAPEDQEAAAKAAEALKCNESWTDDQVASLFKGVIRWKPAGMHKHFRMIAISEHLRNHGFDPDTYQHTRIPHIWQKLRTYYNLNVIDERENFEDDDSEERYVEFRLPLADYYDAMMARAVAEEASVSPPQLDIENQEEVTPSSSPPKKRRRRADTASSRTRAASREETEETTDAPSPAARPARGRGRARGGRLSKAEKADTTEEEDEEEEEEEEQDEEEEGEEDEEEGDEENEEESESASEEEPSEEDKKKKSKTAKTSGRGRGGRRGRGTTTRGRRGRRGRTG